MIQSFVDIFPFKQKNTHNIYKPLLSSGEVDIFIMICHLDELPPETWMIATGAIRDLTFPMDKLLH